MPAGFESRNDDDETVSDRPSGDRMPSALGHELDGGSGPVRGGDNHDRALDTVVMGPEAAPPALTIFGQRLELVVQTSKVLVLVLVGKVVPLASLVPH